MTHSDRSCRWHTWSGPPGSLSTWLRWTAVLKELSPARGGERGSRAGMPYGGKAFGYSTTGVNRLVPRFQTKFCADLYSSQVGISGLAPQCHVGVVGAEGPSALARQKSCRRRAVRDIMAAWESPSDRCYGVFLVRRLRRSNHGRAVSPPSARARSKNPIRALYKSAQNLVCRRGTGVL